MLQNKVFSNLVCLGCHGVFHPSYLERKSYKYIQGYKVYCSTKCEDVCKHESKHVLLHKQLEKKGCPDKKLIGSS